MNYPMIGDTELKVAKLYDMLPADSEETSEGRTAEQCNRSHRVYHRSGQEDQVAPELSHDHGSQLSGIAAGHRFHAADGQAQSCHPATGSRATMSSSSPLFPTRKPGRSMPTDGNHPSLIFVSFPSRSRLALA